MRYQVTIRGVSPLITHNGAAGLDKSTPANVEKSEIEGKGSNRTSIEDARYKELDCLISLWLDERDAPTIPGAAIRACIVGGAKRDKRGRGSLVKEGLRVEGVQSFDYNREALGETLEELGKRAQFTAVVKTKSGGRVLKTRARFEEWSCVATLECYDDLVDQRRLEAWLDIAGRRVGLGDWRPEKSGHFGRFEAEVRPLG